MSFAKRKPKIPPEIMPNSTFQNFNWMPAIVDECQHSKYRFVRSYFYIPNYNTIVWLQL